MSATEDEFEELTDMFRPGKLPATFLNPVLISCVATPSRKLLNAIYK
jgi:hypothetical protein